MRDERFAREISHDEAEQAALALIDAHFRNGKRRVKICIPTESDDTDVVLVSYIRQQRKLTTPSPTGEQVQELDVTK